MWDVFLALNDDLLAEVDYTIFNFESYEPGKAGKPGAPAKSVPWRVRPTLTPPTRDSSVRTLAKNDLPTATTGKRSKYNSSHSVASQLFYHPDPRTASLIAHSLAGNTLNKIGSRTTPNHVPILPPTPVPSLPT